MAHVSLGQSSFPNSSVSLPVALEDKSAPVLFLFLEIFSQEGGIQSYVRDIFQAYEGIGVNQDAELPKVDVFLLRDRPDCDNPFNSPQLTFHYFLSSFPVLGRIRFAIALFFYLLLQRPRKIFCGHILLAPLVQRLCGWFNVPYTILTYGKEVWNSLDKPSQSALQQATSIWTISRYTGDRLCQSNHIAPGKLQFLPCAIDEAHFTPGPKQIDLLERYNISHESKVLVTVARLWSGDIYKGVDITIRALPAICMAIPNIQYLVIGRGDDQPRLAQLAKDLGVEEHVIFAGFVATEELRAHYRLADAYVMPSQEGFGIVYLEAMACGIPVIAGDDDGSADPLQDGRVGWQVPHRDPQAVAAACMELLQGKDQRCKGEWLRTEAIAAFGKQTFQHTLRSLIMTD